ncbi:sensor histidine kinase [Nonomuraea sediminis]|uniref:sensor histidine kinase n=1 Tax=Nonomuraea sediminis TaxID=2835864 RepID=UPI0027E0A053|nr:histidine kinase [Nonomuraea sediminis]
MLARHQDALVIALLALCCVIQIRYFSPAVGDPWAMLTLHAALLVPLARRRRHPVAVFAVVALASLAGWLAGFGLLAANGAVLIAMYGVAARSRLRWAIAAGAVAELGIALLVLRPDESLVVLAKEYAAFSVFVVAIWIAGIQAGTRRRYVHSLVERARQQALITAAAERARIARELHDVVAHDVSVIVLHADGAGYALHTEPDLAAQALQTISATGRQALAEMRRLVGVLRDDTGTHEPHAPQPGLAALGDLVDQIRTAGLPTDLTLHGPARPLPEGLQLAIYRIVQEALTNALKHGGPGTRATVEVDLRPEEIRLDIADDGRGAPALQVTGGHGLAGMRERAALYGGDLHAGPLPGGGFHVSVRMPAGHAG